jgi:Flp pilus assembly protein TadD
VPCRRSCSDWKVRFLDSVTLLINCQFNTDDWPKLEYWQASDLLGVELAGEDKVTEAQEQFQSVIRLRPDYARAHLNLGVALAKQGKFEPALDEFNTTLRLNPDSKLASQHIATIQAMERVEP